MPRRRVSGLAERWASSELAEFVILDEWLMKNAQRLTGRTCGFSWPWGDTEACRRRPPPLAWITPRTRGAFMPSKKLVERRPEGFVLTLAGTHTLAVASDMDSASRTLGRAGPDGAPKGLVRINAPPGLTHGYLVAKLSTMAAAFPGLDIDLATDVRSISLERHEADIAVRIGRPDDGDVIAKPVATIAYGFYATAEACARLTAGE